jgi:hypothetical protein
MAAQSSAAPGAETTFASLPHAIVLRVFEELPLDERARLACVCRGWRATLDDISAWSRLDLSPKSGVARERVTDAFLRAAAAKARGGLTALDVSGCSAVTPDALVAIVAANGGPLRDVRVLGVATDDGDTLRCQGRE